MNKLATSLTPSRGAGVEGPSIDELIKSGSLHQRLAAARAAREKALAERGEPSEQFLSGLKPWERPEYKRGEPRKLLRDKIARDRNAPAAPVTPTPFAPPMVTVAEPDNAARPVPLAAPSNRRLRLLQVASGAAFGVAVGVGLGYWFAGNRLPDATATIALTDEAPAPLRADGVTDGTGIAVPAADALPRTADAPQLSHVISLSAALPSIAGGGPVRRDAAEAPSIAEVQPLMPESAVVAPRFIAAPTPGTRGDLSPPAGGSDLRLATLAAPGRIVTAPPPGTLPAPDASLPALPAAPGIAAIPATLRVPEVVALPPGSGDTPLATQETPLPLSRSAPDQGLILIVHAPAGLSDGEVAAVESRLADEGFGEASAQPVDFTVSRTNVRYFSPEDAAAAGAVAEALGAKLRDFTSFSPRPPRGTIEVWLAGQGGSSAKAVKTVPAKGKGKVSQKPKVSAAEALKQRLVRQLRAGTLN